MTIYFVRHAEPDYGDKDCINRGLTIYGIQQTEYIKDYFEQIEIKNIYSSPFRRAKQTLEKVSLTKNLDIISIDFFRERKAAESNTNKEAFENFALRQWTDFTFSLPGGESLYDVADRYIAGVNMLVQNHNENDSVIVGCHITGLCAYLSEFGIINNYSEFQNVANRKPWIVKCLYYKKTLIKVISVESLSVPKEEIIIWKRS